VGSNKGRDRCRRRARARDKLCHPHAVRAKLEAAATLPVQARRANLWFLPIYRPACRAGFCDEPMARRPRFRIRQSRPVRPNQSEKRGSGAGVVIGNKPTAGFRFRDTAICAGHSPRGARPSGRTSPINNNNKYKNWDIPPPVEPCATRSRSVFQGAMRKKRGGGARDFGFCKAFFIGQFLGRGRDTRGRHQRRPC